ncbi:cytochrome P450 [Novosphingobium sp. KACC 22771]|uniref:cytochrome P450 n=1 Tax=Novosphingobium sp. KACC 22771 TaxID=3025670 RepID=UPI002366FD04|nr:cytochrome P450 [Novosphingobium sp. KACC 22771]WDF71681.1 cytochrome P450 [Novosphingobium sp. KACC 22771]
MPECPFTPPYPVPLAQKPGLIRRFYLGWWKSWLDMLHGRAYTMKLGVTQLPAGRAFMVNDMALVEQVLDDAARFPKHRMVHDMLAPMIGNSVFVSNGEEWAHQRAMINPAFVHTNLKRAFPLMAAATRDMIARMRRQADAAGGAAMDIDPLMTHVTADVIFRTIFSVKLGEAEAEAVYRAFAQYQTVSQRAHLLRMYRLPGFGLEWRARKLGQKVRAVFAPIVAARVAQERAGERRDILDALLNARHPVTGAGFSAEQLVDQLALIFLAGHETTATSLGWALYLLSECPEMQDRLHAEIEAATRGGALDYEHVKALDGVRNLYREALRLYPPVGFLPRTSDTDLTMRDKRIGAGELMLVAPWLVQRNPGNWACPHTFAPDRFATPEGAAAMKEAWIPFGKGERICIGAGFAQQEAALILAEIIRNFRLEYPAGRRRPEVVARLTLRPRKGFGLIVRAR